MESKPDDRRHRCRHPGCGTLRGCARADRAATSRKRRARSIASAAGSARPSPPSRSSSRCSTCTPPTRSSPRTSCGRPTSAWCWCCASCCSRWRARFRDRIRWWDYLLAAVSAGTMLYVLSQGAYFGDRATAPDPYGLDRRRGLHCAAARSDAALDRLDHAGRCHVFSLYALFGHTCRRPGPTAAMRSRTSSPTST